MMLWLELSGFIERVVLPRRPDGLILCLILLLAPVITGCVSTKQLYARYNQQVCNPPPVVKPVVEPVVEPVPWYPTVFFAFDSSELLPGMTEQLGTVAHWLSHHPDYRLLVRGFADSTGPATYNRALSRRRAMAVVNWLVSRGLKPGRMVPSGVGSQLFLEPPVPGQKGEAMNRRVELLPLDTRGYPVPITIRAESPTTGSNGP